MINSVNTVEGVDSGRSTGVISDPIAIVGIGCRFPGGVDGTRSFWELLSKGADGIVEVPPERWNVDLFYDSSPSTPGKMYTRSAGFLTQKINEFDASFFGMSPREAGFLDPQQRVLMEVAWEALEDAGLDPEKLGGSDTGVYIGGFMVDSLLTQFSSANRDQIGSHTAIGSTLAILSNRLSYVFDLRGPSITMDTACSSSLVALHEACQSIWSGECGLALCGGVNIMLRPESPIVMCKGGFLSPDGRSQSFDKRANGYGRGEGAGIVVLKPYSAAKRDGDSIYALVRGTGANQDGRTDGITAPNPEAQEALMRKVCLNARVDPREICYVEAHGTGTALGDPIEAGAIGAVMGKNRSQEDACIIGSVKANIGHLEAASGIAGLIKVALCLQEKAIPPLANLNEPNPNIPFAELGLRLPLTLEPVPARKGPAFMAINSFGYGGTNAHALLEEYKPDQPAQPINGQTESRAGFQVLPFSARSKKALTALAKAYRDRLIGPDAPALGEVCYSAALRRGHHDQRVALLADSRDAMASQLERYIEDGTGLGIVTGSVTAKGQKPVFVMTGMGPQTWSMGRELYRTEPVFRAMAEECDEIFQRVAGWSILKEMLADEKMSRIAETQIAQPANFVIQASLTTLWRSWGVEPAAVVGHSVGEVTAAYLAGVLSLEDAVIVSHHRSRIQKKAAGVGTMLAVGLSTEDIQPYLAPCAGQVSLAAANGPTSITLAGDTDALKRISAQLQGKGTFNRFLAVEVAYHSHTMEPLKDEVLEALAGIAIHPARIPLYSTVTGDLAPAGSYDAAYWSRNIREPVFFEKAMGSLIRDGHRIFLEVGPHPVLSTSIKECLAYRGAQGVLLASLRRDKPERHTMLEALAGLYTAGGLFDWNKFCGYKGNYIKLPSYPWQKEVYWTETESSLGDRIAAPKHALLGQRTDGPEPVWESTLNSNLLPFLPDHRVENLVVLPGAAYVEIGLAMHQALFDRPEVCLENLEFNKALIISPNTQPRLHNVYDSRTRRYSVFSRERAGAAWNSHAHGYISQLPLGSAGKVSLADVRSRCVKEMESQVHYSEMSRRGAQYGPYFQSIKHLWVRPDGNETLARIEGHPALAQTGHNDLLHPGVLDSCFQCLLASLAVKGDENVYVPVKIDQVQLYSIPKGPFWCHGKFTDHVDNIVEGDVTLFDDQGLIMAEARGVRAQALSNRTQDEIKNIDEWLYQFSWEEAPLNEEEVQGSGRWLVFCDQDNTGERLSDELKASGAETVITVKAGLSFKEVTPSEYIIRKDCKADYAAILERAQLASLRGIVYCWGLDASLDEDVGTDAVVSAMYLVQSLAYAEEGSRPTVYFITRNAQPVEPTLIDISVEQAPLIGFVRVADNEFPLQDFRLVDFEPSSEAVPRLAREILSTSLEEEVSLRVSGRYISRLARRSGQELEQNPDGKRSASAAPGETSSEGSRNAASRLSDRRKPGRGEVEVALSLISLVDEPSTVSAEGGSRAASPTYAGGEAFGIITAVGPQVETCKTGDRVLVRLHAQPGRFVTVHHRDVYQSKTIGESGVDPTQVTSLSTAYYALQRIARLQKGEHLLIHSATSSVGLAAIEVARWLEANIFVTADTIEQRDYLSSLGLEHVYDSSSSAFIDQIRSAGHRGLDVVLNSFGGEIGSKTIALLAPFGRCVNVGGSAQPQAQFSASVDSNQVIANLDIYALRRRRPELFDRVLQELDDLLFSGDLKAPVTKILFPTEVGDINETEKNAPFFGPRFVNFGEVLFTPGTVEDVHAERFRSDGSYLITGGFGGFGLEIAKWLVEQGVRHIALVGRSGATTPESRQALDTLKTAGAQVLSLAADISEESEVVRIFSEIAEKMPPLRGIFHAAAVLDDGAIRGLFPSKFETAMKPKAKGAWLLHRHSLSLELDYFVLFSSVGSLVGNPGQATYVASNSFLDMLAPYRRNKNLPAICINWGALGKIGMAARHKGVEEYLNRTGFGSFTPTQAIKVLDKILDWRPTCVGAAIMNWRALKKSYSTIGTAPRNTIVMARTSDDDGEAGMQGPLYSLSRLNDEDRKKTIRTLFLELLSKILRTPADRIDDTQSLLNMGMDSLMGIEIQEAIEKKIGVKVSTLELMKGTSLADMIIYLAGAVEASASAKTVEDQGGEIQVESDPRLAPSVDDLGSVNLADVDAVLETLSDAEVEQALELLAKKGDLA